MFDWLGDLYEGTSNILGDIWSAIPSKDSVSDSWLGKNPDWILPAVGQGSLLYFANEAKKDAQKKDIELAQQQNEENLQNYKDAYNAYLAATAKPTVDPATINKAISATKQGYSKARGIFEPYHKYAMALTPDVVATYKKGLDQLALLDAYMKAPEFLQRMNNFTKPEDKVVQLPSYLR